MRAWQRFKALDESHGPLKFTSIGGKRWAVLLVWKTRDKAWTQDAEPLRPASSGFRSQTIAGDPDIFVEGGPN